MPLPREHMSGYPAVSSASGGCPLRLVPRHDLELAYAVAVDLGIGPSAKRKRVVKAYAGLVAGLVRSRCAATYTIRG